MAINLGQIRAVARGEELSEEQIKLHQEIQDLSIELEKLKSEKYGDNDTPRRKLSEEEIARGQWIENRLREIGSLLGNTPKEGDKIEQLNELIKGSKTGEIKMM